MQDFLHQHNFHVERDILTFFWDAQRLGGRDEKLATEKRPRERIAFPPYNISWILLMWTLLNLCMISRLASEKLRQMTRSGDQNPGYLLLLGDCTCYRGFDECSNSALCVFLRLRYVFPRRCWVKMTREIRILTQPSTRTFKLLFGALDI